MEHMSAPAPRPEKEEGKVEKVAVAVELSPAHKALLDFAERTYGENMERARASDDAQEVFSSKAENYLKMSSLVSAAVVRAASQGAKKD